jgi:hypothetical protein
VAAVQGNEVVAFFGAGASLPSGLRSAVILADRIVSRILEISPSYITPTGGAYLSAVAADPEALAGRPELESVVLSIVNLPWRAQPTSAHRIGGHLFKQIITTNFDDLIEQALEVDEGCGVSQAPTEGIIQRIYRPRALEIRTSELGTEHPEVGTSLVGVAPFGRLSSDPRTMDLNRLLYELTPRRRK